jgi:hypothetical protein
VQSSGSPPLPQNLKRTFQKLAPIAREGDSLANLDYCPAMTVIGASYDRHRS